MIEMNVRKRKGNGPQGCTEGPNAYAQMSCPLTQYQSKCCSTCLFGIVWSHFILHMIYLFLLLRSTESGPAESNGTNSDHVEEPAENINSSNQSCQKTRHMFTQTERSGYATLIDMLSDEDSLKTFTGLHSFELLDAIVLCLTDLVEDKARGRKNDMSLKNRVILTFVKLKQNLSFTSLGILFGIKRQSCSHYFRNMVPKLSTVMETMIPWPDHETIRMNLPVAFKNYRNTD